MVALLLLLLLIIRLMLLPLIALLFLAAYPAAAADCKARRPVLIQNFDWLSHLGGRCWKRAGRGCREGKATAGVGELHMVG